MERLTELSKAIDYLVAQAVCRLTDLYCDEHCPFFYKEDGTERTADTCSDVWTDDDIVQAVKTIIEQRKEPKYLSKAKEDGSLLILPCKIGDKVYIIGEFEEFDGTTVRGIEETTLAGYINENGREFHLCHSPEFGSCDVELNHLFLTREEAERVLEGGVYGKARFEM